MLNSSLAKIRLYYDNARARRRKQDAASQLAMLHSMFAGSAAVENSKGYDLFKAHEASLRSVIDGPKDGPDKNEVRPNLEAIKKNLIASGARIAHSPLQK